MRHTRIIATLGPSTSTAESIQALVEAGVDIFRLNFSHGTRETHAALVAEVREASRKAGRFVAILQDLPGPKIRIGPMREPAMLMPGVKVSPGVRYVGNSADPSCANTAGAVRAESAATSAARRICARCMASSLAPLAVYGTMIVSPGCRTMILPWPLTASL
jgi:pyruvate kinase